MMASLLLLKVYVSANLIFKYLNKDFSLGGEILIEFGFIQQQLQ